MATDTKSYVPDTSHAEKWLTDDTFIWNGMKFKVLPNFEVVHIPKNSKGKGAKHDDK